MVEIPDRHEMDEAKCLKGADHHQPSVRCAFKRASEGLRSSDGSPDYPDH